jgi:uncharacterized protein YdhG (YjbR/CyaY superfamily)
VAPKLKNKPTTIDEYLAGVSADQRAVLEKLRKIIHTAVPKAVECIDYGVAAFRLNGKAIAGFGAGAKHCSYSPMSGATIHTLELNGYETTKGSIHFSPDKPLPAALVRKLVKARITEIKG